MPFLTPRSKPIMFLSLTAICVAVVAAVTSAGECPASRPEPGDAAGSVTVIGSNGGDAKPESKPAGGAEGDGEEDLGCLRSSIESPAEGDLDPAVFFDRLVHHYRGLASYRDTVRLVHVTKRDGEESARLETEIGCEVRDGDLHVTTPTSQARDALSLGLPVRNSPAAGQAKRGYDLWLAPHMALKFDDDPLKHFRAGVDEGFTATEAESVTIDNRKMVHLELRSGDGLSEDCAAKFDIFVNPETMLVECIAGEQRLPDGASSTTTLHITPQETEGGEPAVMQ